MSLRIPHLGEFFNTPLSFIHFRGRLVGRNVRQVTAKSIEADHDPLLSPSTDRRQIDTA
jgi:hypothetical protein